MKPLFARFVPAIVSEQPISAREDARLFKYMTGLGYIVDPEAGEVEDKHEEDYDDYDYGRRVTAVAMSVSRVAAPGRIWDPRRGLKGSRRSW
jgi:hypothetical protein